jgi:predicted lipid-binding transport protein (Tim44 family)
MTSINPNSGVNTNYYQQGAGAPQPATYVPGMNTSYRPDQYQQNRPQQQGGLGGLFNNANNKPYVTKQSVMTGLTGAAVGFMVGGPMGAIIGGAIGLLLSVIMNIVNMSRANKSQVPQQPVQIYPNQQNQQTQGNNSAQQQYYQRMQQQQNQQMYQQQNQQTQGK